MHLYIINNDIKTIHMKQTDYKAPGAESAIDISLEGTIIYPDQPLTIIEWSKKVNEVAAKYNLGYYVRAAIEWNNYYNDKEPVVVYNVSWLQPSGSVLGERNWMKAIELFDKALSESVAITCTCPKCGNNHKK